MKVWINGNLVEKKDAKLSVYDHGTLYGDGDVAPRIARALADLEPYVQKRLHYPAGSGDGAN